MTEDNSYFVNFHINAKLGFGESIRICGNISELGMNEKEKSLELFTTPEKHPLWYNLEPIGVPENFELEFSVLVYCGKELVRYETETPYHIKITESMDIVHALDDKKIQQIPTLQIYNAPTLLGSAGSRKSQSYSSRSLTEQLEQADTTQSLLLVSQFLPVDLKRSPNGKWTAEFDELRLLAGITWKSYYSTFNSQARYVGCIPMGIDVPIAERRRVEDALRQLNCFPVFIDEDVLRDHYYGFCKKVLWPVLHNSVNVFAEDNIFADRAKMDRYFAAYSTVNDTIAKCVEHVHKEDEIVWIQGYQLMLVPSSLSRRLKSPTRIGIFFHTPFPASDMFSMLPWRDSFLHSLLTVNHIGFHLYEYLRHFSNLVRRLLGVQMKVGEMGKCYFEYNGRHIMASSSFMGIEPKVIQQCMETQEYLEEREKLLGQIAGRRAMVSVCYLERLKGIPLQLNAIESLLVTYPSLRDSVVFVMYGLAADGCSDYEFSRQETQDMINRINGTLSTSRPVILYHEVPFLSAAQRAAIWSVGEILVCTPIREGMNAFPLEYITVRSSTLPPTPGVVLLSEFTAPARVLSGSLYVNPWSVSEVVQCYRKALSMGQEEREGRFRKLEQFVYNNPTSQWIRKMLTDISSIPLSSGTEVSLGLGYFRRVVEMKPNFSLLLPSIVGDKWISSKHRAVFLDYGGTLVDQDNYKGIDRLKAFSGQGSFRSPPPTVQEALTDICNASDAWVFVVSGRSKEEVEKSLQGIPNIGMAAEEGFFYRLPGKLQWITLNENREDKWREISVALMQRFASSTNGTFVETKESAVLWQFKDADPDFGQMQAMELEDQLHISLEAFDVEIIKGRDYVQVRPKNVNKGVFVMQVLELLRRTYNTEIDLVMCFGDDTTDESMFQSALDYVHNQAQGHAEAITCTVGNKPSDAEYYVHDVTGVHDILQNLQILIQRSEAQRCMYDIANDLDDYDYDGTVYI